MRRQDSDREVVSWSLRSIDRLPDEQGIRDVIRRLNSDYPRTKWDAAELLGRTGGDSAQAALRERLEHPDAETRSACMRGLAETLDEVDRKLVSEYLLDRRPWDPKEPVDESRTVQAAMLLKLPTDEIRRRYETLADRFGLKLSWRQMLR